MAFLRVNRNRIPQIHNFQSKNTDHITKVQLSGGDLKVTASSAEDIITAAEGSGSSGTTTSSRMGVGAGIALAITGVDVIATKNVNKI